jgi:hypothetical protein
MIKNGFGASLIILVIMSIGLQANAQKEIAIDDLNLDQDPSLWYDNLVGQENSSLQMGVWNTAERHARVSHPYLGKIQWANGDINYRGQLYHNAPMMYNVVDDQLLLRREGDQLDNQAITLYKNQVSSFTIEGKLFELLNTDIIGYENGYFEIMYRGESALLVAKRIKKIEVSSNTTSEYVSRDRYYIKTDSDYLRIFNKATIIRQFPEYKSAIRKYARENSIRGLNSTSDYQLIRFVEFCNQISTK